MSEATQAPINEDDRGAPRRPFAERRFFRGSDLGKLLIDGLANVAVRTVPKDRWNAIAEGLAGLNRRRARKHGRFHRAAEAVFAEPLPEDVTLGWSRENRTMAYRRSLATSADRSRRGWSPRFVFEGLDHLEAAVARGRGTILWCDSTGAESIVSLKAMAQTPFRLATVSHETHGPARSRVGNVLVNGRWQTLQRFYVTERLVFGAASPVAATRRLATLLQENGIVRIANNAIAGKSIEVPIGRAFLAVASTPLALAVQGAALLPLAVIEEEPLATYRIRIGAPLAPDPILPRTKAMADLAAKYVAYLLPLIRAHPGQWLGWNRLRLPRPPQAEPAPQPLPDRPPLP